ncbi:MAG: ribbon-helix-helix protein, CopG family [Betaproteobacteria bacterium]|nr:ribbon-helix-helix protein, CopG family [Betaproteobacteria bacterium]
MAVSLRVPENVKRRIAKLAEEQDKTPHAFMLEAIRDRLDAEEARAAFHAEARRRLARMKKSGLGVPANEVFDYLLSKASGNKARQPKSRNHR